MDKSFKCDRLNYKDSKRKQENFYITLGVGRDIFKSNRTKKKKKQPGRRGGKLMAEKGGKAETSSQHTARKQLQQKQLNLKMT